MSKKELLVEMLKEELYRWDELLGTLSIEEITDPVIPLGLSIKDTLGHLHAWQQRSLARLEAGIERVEPQFPVWPEGLDPEADDVDEINAWIQSIYGPQHWGSVYPSWKAGFARLIELAESISEEDMFDADKYPWLQGYRLADVLSGTYEHHHIDHLQPLLAWLEEQRGKQTTER